MTKSEKVYLNLHESYVKQGLINKQTQKEFNLATMPKGTVVAGQDVSGFTFSPFYVNKPNKFENGELVRDEQGHPVADMDSPMVSIPVFADKEIWLKKDNVTVKVMPDELNEGLKLSYKKYLEQKQAQTQEAPEVAQPEQIQEQKAQEAPVETQEQTQPEQVQAQPKPAKKERLAPGALAQHATEKAQQVQAEHVALEQTKKQSL